MIRPSLRAAIGFALTLPLALVVVETTPGLWPVVVAGATFVLCAIALDAAISSPSSRLSLTLTAPARIAAGDILSVGVALAGAPSARSVVAMLESSGPVPTPDAFALPVDVDGRADTQVELSTVRRGVVRIKGLWLKWRGPLGLAERVARLDHPLEIDVVPDVRSIRSEAFMFRDRQAAQGVKTEIERGDGAEYESLRDHVAGMDNRFIDWKQSAKHRKLLSKEFRIERNHQVVLAFDTGHLMSEPIGRLTRLDHAINAGLQLGWVALRTGDFVGEFAFDARVRAYVSPRRGARSFAALQRDAGRLGYFAEETNFTLGLAELNARLKRRALVVLFTEFVDTTTAQLLMDGVQRMANRHAVVFVTLDDPWLSATARDSPRDFPAVARALVAADFLKERKVVHEKLQRLGVHCLETPAKGLAVSLVNRYLAIKTRGLI